MAKSAALTAVARRKAGSKKPLRVPRMPGPHAPDPKPSPGSLGAGGKFGAYAIPGLGEYGEAKNNAAYRKKHAFNPGRKTSTFS